MRQICLILFLVTFSKGIAQDMIPSSSLENLYGKKINIKTLCKDKNIVVIPLWATWCVPCINELDAINDEYEDLKEELNFTIYAVSVDDSRSVKLVKPLVNGRNWDFDVFLDTNNNFKRALGVTSIPATIIVKNGVIVKKFSGYKPGSEDELFNYLKTL